MRSVLLLAIFTVTTATSVLAEEGKADPRAVEYCKAKAASFVEIANCLPDAHVSFKTLDAFDKIYPPSAKPLKVACLDGNKDDVVGATSCVTEAIKSAVGLKKSLPDGASIDDTIYAAVADEGLQKALRSAQKSAQSDFPEKRIWGGARYSPYK